MPQTSRLAAGLFGGKSGYLLLAAGLLVAVLYMHPLAAVEQPKLIPAPSAAVFAGIPNAVASEETVVFAGGCFWGVQAVFQHTKGVLNAVSGYAGGDASTANYATVSEGGSGHAESVQVRFDPRQVSFGQLLQIYFSVAHDPTQSNRQSPDVGPQYRSALFFQDPSQQRVAQRYVDELNAAGVFGRPVVTEISPLKAFYPAESYHQNYATRHPDASYIAIYDRPKVAHLKTLFPALYRDEPVLVTP